MLKLLGVAVGESTTYVDMFEVNIVPQGEKQLIAIKELLPKLKSEHDRGGEVFKIGDFFQKNTPMRFVKNILILEFILTLYE